ncbi:MAG: rod shape determining protein RodA [Patescibacteria group bacterium]|nr:rod shape determining protein RodA [Patescibacteria group bacterium]
MKLSQRKGTIDWFSFGAALALGGLGLLTMHSWGSSDPLFEKQVVWIFLSVLVFFGASQVDWRFLRSSGVAASIFAVLIVPLVFLLMLGTAVKGARSWISLGGLGIEPAEFVKLALIILLAKYFSRRHIEIKNFKHILVSGVYAGLVFVLVEAQPDFGGAIIVGLIWLGMVLFSGISQKHLLTVIMVGVVGFAGLWFFGFHDYQRQRIMTFVHPTHDIYGSGYNVYQSTIAVGSGELWGKGIGYGTQSKLRFLPEYQTDFIFAAYAEEWGFAGVCLAFLLYGIIFWRLLSLAPRGASNFETLFTIGILSYLAAHFVLHVGINLGVLPVTGTTVPFMSYGGSHLLAEFLALGMVSGMAAYARAAHRDALNREFSGGYDH